MFCSHCQQNDKHHTYCQDAVHSRAYRERCDVHGFQACADCKPVQKPLTKEEVKYYARRAIGRAKNKQMDKELREKRQMDKLKALVKSGGA